MNTKSPGLQTEIKQDCTYIHKGSALLEVLLQLQHYWTTQQILYKKKMVKQQLRRTFIEVQKKYWKLV